MSETQEPVHSAAVVVEYDDPIWSVDRALEVLTMAADAKGLIPGSPVDLQLFYMDDGSWAVWAEGLVGAIREVISSR